MIIVTRHLVSNLSGVDTGKSRVVYSRMHFLIPWNETSLVGHWCVLSITHPVYPLNWGLLCSTDAAGDKTVTGRVGVHHEWTIKKQVE
jgi:hypothetical protein